MSHFSSTFSTTVPFVGKLPVDWGAKDATHSSRTLIIKYIVSLPNFKDSLRTKATLKLAFNHLARVFVSRAFG